MNEVDNYIGSFPTEVQSLLEQLRAIIKQAAPDATEIISYGMPAYKMKQTLVYFAAFKHHIGFYPTASAIQAFCDRLADYKWSKGAVQFPLDKPLPTTLISQMVQYRVQENMEKNKTTKR